MTIKLKILIKLQQSQQMIPLFNLLLLLLLINVCLSTILITSPAINPFDQSLIPYKYSNIGNVPYGKTLTFDLVQDPLLNLCQVNKNLNSQQENQAKHYTTPTYLISDASLGTCSFTTEAINAQQLGVKGVVFVSDMVNYYDKIVQVDDGNGRKVHITVLFISKMTYRQLHNLKNVHIKVQFENHLSQKVNLTYFLSSSGRHNYIFLRQFKPLYEQIKQRINFYPLYHTIKCSDCLESDCLVSNDYCSFQMDTYKDGMGKAILQEQLRQYTIWKQYGVDLWWAYMEQFDKLCTVQWAEAQFCGNQILKQLSISEIKIKGAPQDLMRQWKVHETSAGFISTPSISLNEDLYSGSLSPQQVFSALCSSLIDPPEACTGQAPPSSSYKLVYIIVSIVVGCLVAILIGFVLYKKCVKKQLTEDMYSKVNELVAKYATQVQQHTTKRKNRTKLRLNEEI